MSTWRIIVSFLFGVATIFTSLLGGRMWDRYPEAGMVCFLTSLLMVLSCMIWAQDDGRLRKDK